MPSSRGSSRPRDQTQVSCTASRFFTTEPPGKPLGLDYPFPMFSRMWYVLCNSRLTLHLRTGGSKRGSHLPKATCRWEAASGMEPLGPTALGRGGGGEAGPTYSTNLPCHPGHTSRDAVPALQMPPPLLTEAQGHTWSLWERASFPASCLLLSPCHSLVSKW